MDCLLNKIDEIKEKISDQEYIIMMNALKTMKEEKDKTNFYKIGVIELEETGKTGLKIVPTYEEYVVSRKDLIVNPRWLEQGYRIGSNYSGDNYPHYLSRCRNEWKSDPDWVCEPQTFRIDTETKERYFDDEDSQWSATPESVMYMNIMKPSHILISIEKVKN